MTKTKFTTWHFAKILAVLALLGKCSYDIYDGNKMRDSLRHKPKKTISAIVTNEKYFWGNSPVSHFNTYKYKFAVDGKEYWGVAPDKTYQPGWTIKIDYVVENPDYNCSHGAYTE